MHFVLPSVLGATGLCTLDSAPNACMLQAYLSQSEVVGKFLDFHSLPMSYVPPTVCQSMYLTQCTTQLQHHILCLKTCTEHV